MIPHGPVSDKRTALVTAEVFLMLNDMQLKATNKELEDLILGIAAGRVAKDGVADSMRKPAGKARR